MGGCGTNTYQNISREKIDMALEVLKKYGATVSGDNPWAVDTHKFGISLSANWNPGALNLEITVLSSDNTIPCSMIWKYLENALGSN